MHSQVVAAEWAWWIGLLLGAIPLLALAVWYANDAGHCAAFALKRCWRRRLPLPPGHMGLPFIGESLSLLWYFKLARRPDGFVDAKKKRYGDGAGVYRTHLFGSPTVLVCSPAANKFVLQSSQDAFGIRWPAPELVGVSSIVNVEGRKHARLRGFILAAINRPGSLRTIAEVVQPRVVAALRSWAHKGTITAATEIKKVCSRCANEFDGTINSNYFSYIACAGDVREHMQDVREHGSVASHGHDRRVFRRLGCWIQGVPARPPRNGIPSRSRCTCKKKKELSRCSYNLPSLNRYI